ncbi:MAG TPA: hypothetical protein VM785_09235 [Gaiellales bacterium]|nr:hypothetical protein [Gaiellales bacterium]
MPLLIIRPDDWNFPLLLHVAGAMVMCGALVVAAATLLLAVRSSGDDRVSLARFSFRILLIGVLPAYIVMRGAAEWIYSKEGFSGDNDPGWIGIGYITSDLGLLLIIISTVLAGLAARRIRANPDGPSVMTRISMALTFILIAAYVVAVWAMTTKPS